MSSPGCIVFLAGILLYDIAATKLKNIRNPNETFIELNDLFIYDCLDVPMNLGSIEISLLHMTRPHINTLAEFFTTFVDIFWLTSTLTSDTEKIAEIRMVKKV